MTRAFGRTLWVLVAALAVSASPAEAASEPEKPSFSGTWQLNEDESDDPREKMQEMRAKRGGMGGPGGGGSSMGGPGGGMGGRGGEGSGSGEVMGQGLTRLEIRHEEPRLLVIDADDRDRTIYTDGRKVKRDSERGLVEVQAKWKKDKLVVERKQGRGGTLKETYELSPNGDQLYVTTKMGGRMGSMKFRRVYDAVSEDSSGQR
jgi:hypothetical protein